MVEIYKTNVKDALEAQLVLSHIHKKIPGCKANFDLEDCDSILRTETKEYLETNKIITLLEQLGYYCAVLSETGNDILVAQLEK